MDGSTQPKEYLRKAKEAEKQLKLSHDPVTKRAWEHIVVGYLELAEIAGRQKRQGH